MKIIVAHSGDSRSQPLKAYIRALDAALVEAGHQVEQLKIPRPEDGHVGPEIASHRLTDLDPWCDALICLDPFSAVLKHRRKLLWILAADLLPSSGPGAASGAGPAERFANNVIRAACREAQACFAPSPFALREFATWGLDKAALLAPIVDFEHHCATRSPGSELLVIEPLRATSRVDLLLGCIAALPPSFRGRWSAAFADAGATYSAQSQAKALGLNARITFDVRPVDDSELVHFLATSAGLLICEPAAMAVAPQVAAARRLGVPVVVCNDGGAAAFGRKSVRGYQIVPPDGAAIAAAFTNSDANSPGGRASSRSPGTQRTEWTPLLQELGA